MKRFILVLLACCSPGLAAWSLVHHAAGVSNPLPPSMTLAGTTTGNVLTLEVEEDTNVPSIVSAISNTGGATWTLIRSYNPGSNAATIEIWRGDGNTGNATDIITPTFTTAGTGGRLYVQEWANLGAVDTSGEGANGTGGTVNTGVMSWTPGDLLIFAYEFYCDSTSVVSGSTLIDEPDTYGAVAYGTASGASGAATGSGSLGCGNMIVAAAIKPAAARLAITGIPVVM